MTQTDKKDEAVRTRIRSDEKKAFTRLANELGVTPSRLQRRLIREAINAEADLFDPGLGALSEASNQLRSVGRNLNQIARAVNAGNVKTDPLTKFQMTELQTLIGDLDKAFRDVVKRSRTRSVKPGTKR